MVEHGCSKLKVSLMGFALTRKKELSAAIPRGNIMITQSKRRCLADSPTLAKHFLHEVLALILELPHWLRLALSSALTELSPERLLFAVRFRRTRRP
jgi:hypothetical protein